MLWVELCPPRRCTEDLTPSISECDLLGSGVVADITNQVKVRSHCSRAGS